MNIESIFLVFFYTKKSIYVDLVEYIISGGKKKKKKKYGFTEYTTLVNQ